MAKLCAPAFMYATWLVSEPFAYPLRRRCDRCGDSRAWTRQPARTDAVSRACCRRRASSASSFSYSHSHTFSRRSSSEPGPGRCAARAGRKHSPVARPSGRPRSRMPVLPAPCSRTAPDRDHAPDTVGRWPAARDPRAARRLSRGQADRLRERTMGPRLHCQSLDHVDDRSVSLGATSPVWRPAATACPAA